MLALVTLVLLLIDKGSSQGGASCNEDGDFQLTYTFTATPYKNAGDYVKEFRGLLEICYNGTYYGVCSGSYNKQQLAELVCSSLGYDNETTTSTGINSYQFGINGINDITCPDNATSISECSLSLSDFSDSTCRNHYSDLLITCSNRVPACSDFIYQQANRSSFTFSNGTQSYTGRLEVCLNGIYVPVCDSGLDVNELNDVCTTFLGNGYDYTPGQYIGSINDYQTGTSSDVVHTLSCPSDAVTIDECIYNTTSGCPDYEEVITCVQRPVITPDCSGSFLQVSNPLEVTLPYQSTRTYTGRVEACYNGQYVDVCSNTEGIDNILYAACSRYSADYNSTQALYDKDYSVASSGRSVVITGPCNVIFDGLDGCNVTEYDTGCGNNTLSVHCERDCQIFGRLRLQQTATTNYDNGTTGVSGILQFCEYSTWRTVCESDYSDFEAGLFCYQFGYTNGTFLSSNPGGDLTGFGYVNLSCPIGSSTSSSCSILSGDNSVCGSQSTLYCYNTVSDSCYPGDIRMNEYVNVIPNTRGQFPNGTYFISGYMEVCLNGSYHTLCNETLDVESLSKFCYSFTSYRLGYPGILFGSESDYLKPESSLGFYNISCEYNYFSETSCSYSTVEGISLGCDAYGGPALVTCVQIESPPPPPTCSSPRLVDKGNGKYSNGTYFRVGVPEVCVNNTYLPICGSVTQDESVLLCKDAESYYGALSYPTFGMSTDYAMNNEATTVATDLYCPPELFYDFDFNNCNQTLATSSDGCSSYQPQSAITCYNAPIPCEEHSVATSIADSSYSNGVFTIYYIVRYCQSNEYSTVCRTGITDEEARIVCLDNGRSNGYVADNYLDYDHYSSTDQSLVNFHCHDAFSNCSFDVVEGCSDFYGDAVIACNREEEIPDDCSVSGQVRLYNLFNITDGDLGDGVGGVVEICVDGTYKSVCTNPGLSSINTTELAQLTCSDLGYSKQAYSSGSSLSSSSSVIDSVDCPVDAGNFSACSFTTTRSGLCSTHQYDTTVQCYNSSIVVPLCTDGQVRIGHNITNSTSNYEEISGTLEVCVDGVYQQVCGSEAADVNATSVTEAACNDIGYTDGFSYILSYPLTTIIDYVTCPNEVYSLSQCNFSTTDNGSCADNSSFTSIHITCRQDIPPAPACMDGDIQFYNNYTNTLNRDYEYVTEFNGVLEICYNGTYHGVCYGTYDEQEVAETVCSSLGYTGNTTISTGYNYDQYYKNSINDISCPDDFTSLSQCSFSLSNSSNSDCIYHYNDLFITCTNSIPKCLGSLYQLSNQSSFTFSNSTRVYTGRLEVCLNGARVPVCASAISDYQLDDVCRSVFNDDDYVALPGQYIGSINDYQTGTSSDVVHSLSCPSDAVIIDSCQYNTTYGCQNNEEVLTCIRYYNFGMDRCYESNIRQGNNSEVNLPYSMSFYTGRVEICSNGEYVDVCNNTQEAQYFANRSCDYFYSGSIATIIPYDMDYSTAESGGSYSANNCSDIRYNGVGGCSNTTTNSSCAYSPLSVRCERECRNYGDLRLQQTTTTNYDNGTASVSGILQFCESSTWSTVCENNFTDTNINQFCSNFGYTNGSLLMSNPGGDLSTPASYVNLTCSDDYYSCSVEYGDDDVCEAEVSLYCYNAVISDNCYEGQTRLGEYNNQQTYASGMFNNQTSFRIGYVEVCIDGSFHLVCNDNLMDVDIVSSICYNSVGYRLGYPGALYGSDSDYLLPGSSNGVYDISCPSNDYFSLYDCAYSTVSNSSNGCDLNGGPALVTCIDIPYQLSCSGSRLTDSGYGTFSNGTSFYVGRLERCVNYTTYVPICGSLTQEEAVVLCSSSNSLYGALTSPAFGTSYDYAMNNEATTVISDLYCSQDDFYSFYIDSCNQTVSTSNDGCMSFEAEPLITCYSAPQPCRESSVTLDYVSGTSNTSFLSVRYCVSETYASVCRDGISDEEADNVCKDQGYLGGIVADNFNYSAYDYYYRQATQSLINFECKNGSLQDCTYEIVDSCSLYNGDVVIECYIDIPFCYPGQITLLDKYNYTFDGNPDLKGITGYPALCINDTFVPICDTAGGGLLEARIGCDVSTNYTFGFIGSPSFYTPAPLEYNGTLSVTNVSCVPDGNCTNTSSINACEDYATITCGIVCVNGTNRLYNSMTSDGLRATGIPQRCDNGGWSSICTTGSVDPDIPNLVCQNLSYANGTAVPYNKSIHGISPPGSLYHTNISCQNTLESCAFNVSYSNQCLNGDLEYIIQCYDILASPTIVQQPEDVIILNSESTSFTCEFSGDPNPMIQWTFIPPSPFPPLVIMSNGPHSITTQTNDSSVTSTLTISSVSPANIGAYMCTANNGAPTPATGIANLQVIVPPTMNIAVTSGTLSLTEDDSLTLTCTESGALPHLPIVWTKGTTPVLSNSRISITSSPATQDPQTLLFSVESVLTISSAVLSDAGNYMCRTTIVPVLNEVVISTPLTVDVQVRNECTIEAPNGQLSPCVNGYCVDGTNSYFCVCFDGFTGMNCDQEVFVRSAPVFVTQPSEQRILLGDMANFSCIVTGEPQPSITWFIDGQVIPDEVTPYYIITTVAIANRGFYRCSASNSEGTVTSTDAPLFIANIAQYSANVMISEGARKKRQSMTMIQNPLVDSARELAIGREIADNVVIVALDAYLVDGQIQIIYTVRAPVTEDGRLNTTGVADGLNSFGDEVSTQIPSLSISPVMRFDGCMTESTALFDSVQIDWPEIGAGETASLPCPCGDISDNTGLTASRMCVGDFVSISSWSDPRTGQCIYDEYSRELCSAAANDDPVKGAGVLSNVTENASSFDEDTLRVAVAFLSSLADNEDLTTTVAVTLISAINNMASLPSTTLSNNSNAANEILNSFASIANNIPLIDGKAVVIQQTVAITAQEVTPEDFTGLSFTVSTTTDGTLDDNSLSGEGQPTASVMAPDNLLNGIPDADRIAVGVLTDSTFFVQSETAQQTTPISVIVTFDVFSANGKETVSGLDPGITFTFTSSESSNAICSFWNTQSFMWSEDGCTTAVSGSTVTCNCNHLSSFTIVQVNDQPSSSPPEAEDEFNVELITIISPGISTVFALIAIFSHLISSNQRSSQEGKIIAGSHISLTALYVTLMLSGIVSSYNENNIVCGIFSGLFHFTSLVYVMWIFTECLFYVVKLRSKGVRGTKITSCLMIVMFLLNLGIPLAIVGASVGTNYEYYAVENGFCRPQSDPFYYGYIIPMGVIFAISVVCIVIGCMSSLLVPMKSTESSFRKKTMTPHLVAVTILLPIILIAWIFGMVGTDYGVTGAASTVTQYIFGCILMIHAVILLILTLIRTEDTRKAWIRLLKCKTGTTGKYAFSQDVTMENDYADREGIGLEASTRKEKEKLRSISSEDEEISFSGDEKQTDTVFDNN